MPTDPDLLRADAILVCDTGNAAVGRADRDDLAARAGQRGRHRRGAAAREMHSGMFGGAAPDALAALIAMLATLRDERGNTTVARAGQRPRPGPACDYPADSSAPTPTCSTASRCSATASVADMLWARPAVTVLGIDCPPVVGSAAAIQPTARARLNLRVPPGMDAGRGAGRADRPPARGRAVGRAGRRSSGRRSGAPFRAETGGPAYAALAAAMREAYGGT